MKRILRFITSLIVLLFVLAGFVFTSNNSVEVPLWIGVELAPQRLAVWVLLAFIWGGALGLILGYGFFRRIKTKIKIHDLEGRLKKSQANVVGKSADASVFRKGRG